MLEIAWSLLLTEGGDSDNIGFWSDKFGRSLCCISSSLWREATPEEVKKRFEAHLVQRYGADWETMRIKERHPDSILEINEGIWSVDISKKSWGWGGVFGMENGLLYCKGIWVERLEEEVNSLGVNLKAWDELVKDAPQSTFGQKSALKEQIGGEHYKNFEIQPIEFIPQKQSIIYSGQC